MAKFNVANPVRTRHTGVITSEQTASGRTANGAPGFARDAKSELFLLAVTNFVNEKTFYEDAKARDSRYNVLIREVVETDAGWLANMLKWLRVGGNMRSAALVGGIEAARALSTLDGAVQAAIREVDGVTPRSLVDCVLQRADEPGEAIAYWMASYGKKMPIWFKRGIGDAVVRLYTPYNYLKWDSDRNSVRFADVIEFSDIRRSKSDNSGLFKHILDERHKRGNLGELPDGPMRVLLVSRWRFNQIPKEKRRACLADPSFGVKLNEAGLTWEALSGWLQGPMDAEAWEMAIPQMGYGALIKNLRNFDQAGIGTRAREVVRARLIDPYAASKSRLLPMAFLNAYNNVPSDYWKAVLDEAATLSLGNLPSLPGRTLVLVDTSGSMNAPFSANVHLRSNAPVVERLMRWDVAALFGIAIGRVAADAEVVSYSDAGYGYNWSSNYRGGGSLPFELRRGENLLAAVGRFRKTHFIGGGTATKAAVDRHYKGHDRLILLTDEQADQHYAQDVFASVPASVTSYTFNLAGYRFGHAPSTMNRYVVGGLSDAGFRMINAIEQSARGIWPWDVTSPEQPR